MPDTSALPSRTILAEITLLYVFSLVLTFLSHQTGSGIMADLTYAALIFALMGLPWVCIRFWHRRDPALHGTDIAWSWSDAGKGLLTIALLVIPVAAGAYAYNVLWLGHTFHFSWQNYAPIASTLPNLLFTHLLLIALPEEFFYRGYVQSNLLAVLAKTPKTARLAPQLAVLLTAAAFAFAHVTTGQWGRLVTFFPGLLFGALRLKSDNIVGCVLCHALANMLMIVLGVHFF